MAVPQQPHEVSMRALPSEHCCDPHCIPDAVAIPRRLANAHEKRGRHCRERIRHEDLAIALQDEHVRVTQPAQRIADICLRRPVAETSVEINGTVPPAMSFS